MNIELSCYCRLGPVCGFALNQLLVLITLKCLSIYFHSVLCLCMIRHLTPVLMIVHCIV